MIKSKNIFLALLFSVLFLCNIAFAQEWEPPFKIEPDSLSFAMPDENIFEQFDSAHVVLKVRFQKEKNQIKWVDLIKVDLFRSDTTAYHFFNDKDTGWTSEAEPLKSEDYPDQLTRILRSYLTRKLTAMSFKPTKYVEEYRLIPFTIPVSLK